MSETTPSGGMLQLTDQPDGVTVDIQIGLNPPQLDRTKPSHIAMHWLANNMEEVLQRAAFDFQREVIAAAQDAGQAAREAHNADVGVDFATPQPKLLDSNGAVLS